MATSDRNAPPRRAQATPPVFLHSSGAPVAARAVLVAAFGLFATCAALPGMAANDSDLASRLLNIEVDLPGFPERARLELDGLSGQIRTSDPETRLFGSALTAQALVASGHKEDAQRLADQLEQAGLDAHDDGMTAVALMIRSEAHSWAGDTPQAHTLASSARTQAQRSGDAYVRFWANLSTGVAARKLGRLDEALANLQDAYVLAEAAGNPYRRANALYQLSVLNRVMKQADRALDNSRQAFSQAKLAHSTYGMAKAKMAESAALEVLNRPAEELSALQDALAIARNARSDVEESLALINLADIYLRRKEFKTALDLSQRSLQLATRIQDVSLIATSKANIGFALFGLGRIEEGKRPAEEALAEYERSGADAEFAELLEEYGRYLATSGDYKGALALRDRQQKVLEKVAQTIHDKDLMEMQSRFDAEKREREIEKLKLETDNQAIDIRSRQFAQRIWWLLAAVFAASFAIVAVLYRKLRTTNRLLALRNSELSVQSSRDPLTSLYNRRHFQSFINEVHGDADRRRVAPDKPTQAILLIDLDHFKLINDQFGHAAGDAVLVAIARRLREALRETDMIVRWGGEEFLVFVPMAPADRLDEIVIRIMHAVSSEPVNYLGHDLHLTASIGFSPLLLPPGDVALGWERVLGLADQALYLAKLNGRNRAYGVGAMRRSGDDALAAIDANLELAWQKGIVELRVLPGDGAIVSATAGIRPAPASIER